MRISNLEYDFTVGEWLGYWVFRILEKAVDPWRSSEPRWFRLRTFGFRRSLWGCFSSKSAHFIAVGVQRTNLVGGARR